MSLQHLWQMSYDSKTIDILRNSKHAIPIIQSFHLFGITLLLSAMVILNFRMLGIGFREIRLDVLVKTGLEMGNGGTVACNGLRIFRISSGPGAVCGKPVVS